MGLKYTLITGEVVELEIDDVLEIGTSPEVMQEILYYKDHIKKWADADEACQFDDLKFIDKDEEDFDYDLYWQKINEETT